MRSLLLVVAALLLEGCAGPAVRPSPTADVSSTVAAQVRATLTAVVPTAEPTSAHPNIGQDGWISAKLVSGAQVRQVPVAGSAADFVAYRKAVEARDDVGLRDMFLKNRLLQVPIGTRVRVIDAIVDVVDVAQVRFMDGEWATTTGWLDHTWIVAQPPS